jgi:hypothetical protein
MPLAIFLLVVVWQEEKGNVGNCATSVHLSHNSEIRLHLSLTMVSNSKARKLKAAQSRIFATVEDNPSLLDLLEITTSSARKEIFNNALADVLPPTSAFHRFEKDPDELFQLFTTWFAGYPDSETCFSQVHAALDHRQKFFLDNRFMKRQFIRDIHLDWTPDDKSIFFKKVSDFVWSAFRNLSFLS